jgi:hypothetical protein
MPWDVIVIGAGAAGLLAAARAAERGRRTLLLEKNRKPGVKILMSGGTRCNLTHATDARGIVEAFGPPGRFLHSALAALSPAALVELIEAEGVPTKVEATGKIFPVSNKANDVLQALLRRLERSGAELRLGEPVRDLIRADEGFRVVTSHDVHSAEKVILTSGGKSYPGSGTTGDGYAWAAALGHTIVPPRPALTPLRVVLPWVRELMGVTVPDVGVKVLEPVEGDARPRVLASDRGSFLFTHFGLSGPAALNVSRVVTAHAAPASLRVECDFLPGDREDALEEALLQEAARAGKRQLAGFLSERLPRRLVDALLRQAGLDPERKLAELSKPDRQRLVQQLKATAIPITGAMGFEKAEVTAGGVALDEVDSRTMQSKKTPGLYLAGEVLDLDGPIGGYNFQAAFSTGWLAGERV